jgi:glucose-1-phosphatase
MRVKNLIFDLGGVILDLSVEDTLTAFSNLSGLRKEKVKDIFIGSPEFNEFEKGLMNDDAFREFIRKTYAPQATDAQIDECWNAMLLGLPMQKLDLLDALKKEFSVYLLSNTNGIHLHYINEVILKSVTGKNLLDTHFHKAYYSHRMGKRKPEPEIYLQVLEENNLKAGETMFLDDNPHNIESAASLGIQTVYVHHPDVMIHTSTELIRSSN